MLKAIMRPWVDVPMVEMPGGEGTAVKPCAADGFVEA
jgi:hypothetical protein